MIVNNLKCVETLKSLFLCRARGFPDGVRIVGIARQERARQAADRQQEVADQVI